MDALFADSAEVDFDPARLAEAYPGRSELIDAHNRAAAARNGLPLRQRRKRRRRKRMRARKSLRKRRRRKRKHV